MIKKSIAWSSNYCACDVFVIVETFNWSMFEEEKPKELEIPPSVHEQEDGTVLAMCITGTSTKESLAAWIRFLERSNEKLSQIPVVFRLRSPQAEVDVWSDKQESKDLAQWSLTTIWHGTVICARDLAQ